MFRPLRLRGTIGSSYPIEPDDPRDTKRALAGLGLYTPPVRGMNDYPDQGMFKGLKRFQTLK